MEGWSYLTSQSLANISWGIWTGIARSRDGEVNCGSRCSLARCVDGCLLYPFSNIFECIELISSDIFSRFHFYLRRGIPQSMSCITLLCWSAVLAAEAVVHLQTK